MKNFGKLILGAAVVAGGLGLGATTAQAAEFGVYVRGPVAYVPPCPGPGYVWIAGYYNNGYWVPGYWNFAGGGVIVRDRRPAVVIDHDRRFYARDYGHFDRGHDHFRR